MLVSIIYDSILNVVADKQRKKPLPAEVSDVYDKERYETYLNYVSDRKKAGIVFSVIEFIINIVFVFSKVYTSIERVAGGNPYVIFLLTFLIFFIIEIIIGTAKNYYFTFKIEEKYGLNKKDMKEFIKDIVLEEFLNLFVMVALMWLVTFLGVHLGAWTNDFTIGAMEALFICVVIALAVCAFYVIAMLLSYAVLKKQYVFTPLEEGELRDKINKLQESSKKKVKQIFVYNESKKSTMKNAFLLKLFWYREFGIADNFLTENALDELLAVLSHEIGHLKHKKNLLNYITYVMPVIMFGLLWYLICSPAYIFGINEWIRQSFNISVNNYYILMLIYMNIAKPVMFVIGIFGAFKSRVEEKEADMEAVKNGYADALIRTFKQLSSDELINVNPHPLIEFLEYDHPGMYQRIKYIKEADNKRIK